MSALIVNLFGAPGVGKSTGAALLYATLKQAGVNAELITEFAKDKTWERNDTALAAQDYIFAKQHYRIRRVVNQVDVIITDSPLLLSSFYMGHDPSLGRPFQDLVLHAFNSYENMNFFIMRDKPYNPAGRSQTEEESDRISLCMYRFLRHNHVPFVCVSGMVDGYFGIIKAIASQMKARREANLQNAVGTNHP